MIKHYATVSLASVPTERPEPCMSAEQRMHDRPDKPGGGDWDGEEMESADRSWDGVWIGETSVWCILTFFLGLIHLHGSAQACTSDTAGAGLI